MKMTAHITAFVAVNLCGLLLAAALADPLVIAHRGASAYLPEHSIASKVLAHSLGADYIEQDVVLTRDGVPIVFHDLYLDAVTDVASRFEDRARADGRHYVVDFDYAELRGLALHERIDLPASTQRYALRFPADARLFRIHSLADELELVRGLNKVTGKRIGIYVELKHPRWHAEHGLDIAASVLPILHAYGYRGAGDRAYLQSFDAATLRRIKTEKLSALPLIQLIGENRWWPDSTTDYDFLKSPAGLDEIKTYAAGIGPWYRQILLAADPDGSPRFSKLVEQAHRAGLEVHAYTLRADSMPDFVDNFEQLLAYLLVDQRIDGVFTDHPDRVLSYLRSRALAARDCRPGLC